LYWLIPVCVVAAFVAALGLDGVLRWFFWRDKGGCRITRISDRFDFQPTMILFLPGLIANARSMPRSIEEEWAKNGGVWGVEYSAPRFNPKQIVDEVVEFIVRYCEEHDQKVQNIVLIGSSLGGLLAYDVQARLRVRNATAERAVSLVMIDSPTKGSDLHAPLGTLAQVVRITPIGPILNCLSPFLTKLLAPKPAEHRWGVGVNENELARSVKNARKYPLSFYRDQVLYIVKHNPPLDYSLTGRQLFFIRSEGDALVNSLQAMDSWRTATGTRGFSCAFVDADHAAYQLQPLRYRVAFQEVFRRIFEH